MIHRKDSLIFVSDNSILTVLTIPFSWFLFKESKGMSFSTLPSVLLRRAWPECRVLLDYVLNKTYF